MIGQLDVKTTSATSMQRKKKKLKEKNSVKENKIEKWLNKPMGNKNKN